MRSSRKSLKYNVSCRLCLSYTDSGVAEDVLQQSIDILQEIFRIQIDTTFNTDAPFLICKKCKTDLNQCHKFYKKIKRGLDQLRSVNIVNDNDELPIKIERESSVEWEEPIKAEVLNYVEEEKEMLSETVTTDAFETSVVDDNDEDAVGEAEYLEEEMEQKEEGEEGVDEYIEYTEDDPEFDPNNPVEIEEDDPGDDEELFEPVNAIQNNLSDFETRLGRLLANPKLTGLQRRIAFWELTCFKCGAQFENEDKLRIHQKQAHKFRRLYYLCCGRKLSEKITGSHLSYHFNPTALQCPGCKQQNITRSQFHGHLKACKVMCECPECGESFKPDKIRGHIASHQEKPPKAKKERKTKIREDGVVLYNRRKGPRDQPNNYTCDLCKHTFDTWHQIQKHMHNIHLRLNEECSEYVCQHCGFLTKSKEGLRTHIAYIHSGVTKQPCPFCNRQVKRLEEHIKLHHDTSTPTECQDCGRQFPNQRQKDMHWRRKHDTRKKNVCKICGKAYKHKYQLSEHSYSHTGGYKYSCEFCHYQVNYSRNLRVHRKTAHPKEYAQILQNRLKDMYGEKMAPKILDGNKEQLAALALAKRFDIIESEVIEEEPSINDLLL